MSKYIDDTQSKEDILKSIEDFIQMELVMPLTPERDLDDTIDDHKQFLGAILDGMESRTSLAVPNNANQAGRRDIDTNQLNNPPLKRSTRKPRLSAEKERLKWEAAKQRRHRAKINGNVPMPAYNRSCKHDERNRIELMEFTPNAACRHTRSSVKNSIEFNNSCTPRRRVLKNSQEKIQQLPVQRKLTKISREKNKAMILYRERNEIRKQRQGGG